jgi:uncharacterized protein (UPF0264 family)
MILTGLFGGLVYANVLWMILEMKEIAKGEKEIAVNILNIMNFTGIITGALICLAFDNISI